MFYDSLQCHHFDRNDHHVLVRSESDPGLSDTPGQVAAISSTDPTPDTITGIGFSILLLLGSSSWSMVLSAVVMMIAISFL